MSYKKKLIEVALPLEAINVASAREKSIRHGHPSTLHLWWARRPLAACRAVLFASLVDDPASCPDEFPTETAQDAERLRLFGIIERLVQWENSNNPEVLAEAHAEIMKSTDGNPPPVLDPFCGGGSIPLEAQRLGLEAHGSDLNPVAVLITKALIEIPPKFAGHPPVNPGVREASKGKSGKTGKLLSPAESGTWPGATGLADDVRYYGKWMRDEAEKRIGHLYPKVQLPDDMGGGEATVIAWIWARTVKCPNPACGCRMPLVRSFALSTKPGKQAYVEPVVDTIAKTISFTIKTGAETPHEATVGKRGAICLCCDTPVPLDHVRAEGKAKRMGVQMMAVVAEGKNRRIYLPPTPEHEAIAMSAVPDWTPETELVPNSRHMTPTVYGMMTHAELFSNRQLVALSMFSDLISEAREKVKQDALNAGLDITAAQMRADAVATYLAFAIDKGANYWSAVCGWHSGREIIMSTFGRQALPMIWDYTETNPLSSSTGNFDLGIDQASKMLTALPLDVQRGAVQNADALSRIYPSKVMISTDPPYYDSVPYADLSDFFYVWLRKSLAYAYPDLFRTMLVPKSQELVADPFRHGGKPKAKTFFESGLHTFFCNLKNNVNTNFPLTIYYAFKQSESEVENEEDGAGVVTASSGWETFLQSLIEAGFQITATWPMRTEQPGGLRVVGRNALASSVILACRPRPDDAPVSTRREFINALRRELEEALLKMMHGNVAPVDLAQATIGPGMAVYSRYKQVMETDGKPLRVRAALQIINQELDTVLSAQEGDYDTDTRFCLAWFEQFGMTGGAFGEADVMARAKNTSVAHLGETGVLDARAGKVRLLKREEYPQDWQPGASDANIPVWECTQQLVRALQEQGEPGAARLCHALGGKAEPARDLAYRLYSICERKAWAQEALAYNSLVIAWTEITRLASNPNIAMPHTGLFAGGEV